MTDKPQSLPWWSHLVSWSYMLAMGWALAWAIRWAVGFVSLPIAAGLFYVVGGYVTCGVLYSVTAVLRTRP